MAVIVEYRYSADHGRGCVGIHTFKMLRLCMDFCISFFWVLCCITDSYVI